MIKKVVCFSYSGECSGLAYMLQKEGMQVLFAMLKDEEDIKTSEEKKGKPEDPIDKKRRLATLDGMVEKMDAWKAVAKLKKVPGEKRKEYFLFFDMNHCWKLAEALMGLGFNGNFPTEEDRIMEVSRDKAQDFVKKHYKDLAIPEYHEFKTVDEAKKFLKDTKDVWVLKGKDGDAETFVPDTGDQQVTKRLILDQFAEAGDIYEKAGFILQKQIPKGIELTPEMAFWNGKPIYATVDIELKRKLAGNVGRLVGCAADLVFEVPIDCPLMKIAIPQIIHDVAKRHEGLFVWDAALMFDPEDDKPYFLEFCANRVGWNSFYTQIALLDSATEYFEAVSKGENPFKNKLGQFATSVRIFNDNLDKEEQGKAAEGVRLYVQEDTENDLWYMDVKKEEESEKENEEDEGLIDDYVSAGYGHDLCVVTGYGDSIEEAADRMYMYVDGFTFKKKTYRPKHDYLSRAYSGNILDRYDYGKELFGIQEKDIKISIDFDGVIYDNSEEDNEDGSLPGEPLNGARDGLNELMGKGYDLHIFTARTQFQPIREWLRENIFDGGEPLQVTVSNVKEPSEVYLDNQAIHFENWEQAVKDVEQYIE